MSASILARFPAFVSLAKTEFNALPAFKVLSSYSCTCACAFDKSDSARSTANFAFSENVCKLLINSLAVVLLSVALFPKDVAYPCALASALICCISAAYCSAVISPACSLLCVLFACAYKLDNSSCRLV